MKSLLLNGLVVVLLVIILMMLVRDRTSHFTSGDTLAEGDKMPMSQFMSSKNDRYRLRILTGGRLVLYKNVDGKSVQIWNADSYSVYMHDHYLEVGNDGRAVMRNKNKSIIGVVSGGVQNYGIAPRRLVLENNGNLVLYDKNNTMLWSSGTAGK